MIALLLLLALALAYGAFGSTLWPKCTEQETSATLLRVDPVAFKFEAAGSISSDNPLHRAISRYQKLSFETPAYSLYSIQEQEALSGLQQGAQALTSLSISITNPDAPLTSSASEAYKLTVAAPTATLEAETTWGALRGLETFSQLLTVVKLDLVRVPSTATATSDPGSPATAGATKPEPVNTATSRADATRRSLSNAATSRTDASGLSGDTSAAPIPAAHQAGLISSSNAGRDASPPSHDPHIEAANEARPISQTAPTASMSLARSPRTLYLINATRISDAPRFEHRGLMVDTSRHWLPLRLLRSLLDSMAWNKLNVLHWHLSDDPAFPFQPASIPELSRGAYHPSMVYTPDDLRDVVAYARDRGIRVYVEMDTPGHSQAMAAGLPGLLTECYDMDGTRDGTLGPVNPVPESSYLQLWTLYLELAGLFPDELLHIGGDEVSVKCWKSNPGIQAFVGRQPWGSTPWEKLQGYFTQRLLARLAPLGKTFVAWQEVLDKTAGALIPQNTLIQVWKSSAAAEALQQFYSEQDDDYDKTDDDDTADGDTQSSGQSGALEGPAKPKVKLPPSGVGIETIEAALRGHLNESPDTLDNENVRRRALQSLRAFEDAAAEEADIAGDGRASAQAVAHAEEESASEWHHAGEDVESLTGWENPAWEQPEAMGSDKEVRRSGSEFDVPSNDDYADSSKEEDPDESGDEDGAAADTYDSATYLLELEIVVKKGFSALLSAPWYLDHYAAGPGVTAKQWIQMYQVDPQGFKATAADKARVLGGEACLWGENIDGTNLLQRAWPRASAVAERLWSPDARLPPAVDPYSTLPEDHPSTVTRRRLHSVPQNLNEGGGVSNSRQSNVGAGVGTDTAGALPREDSTVFDIINDDGDDDDVSELDGGSLPLPHSPPGVVVSAGNGASASEEAASGGAEDWESVILDATARLREQRCRMMARGIAVEPGVDAEPLQPNDGCHPDALAAVGAL